MIGGAVVPLPQKTVKSLADTRQLCAGRTWETIFEFRRPPCCVDTTFFFAYRSSRC